MSEPVLSQLTRDQQPGKANAVRLHVPTHITHRVPRLGQLVPIATPPVPAWLAESGHEQDQRWWAGPKALTVAIGLADNPHGRLLHLSAAHPKRLPDYWEMIALREWAFPDTVDAAMIFPRKADWVNTHQFCLHLWQVPVHWALL